MVLGHLGYISTRLRSFPFANIMREAGQKFYFVTEMKKNAFKHIELK